jgi:3D (Asp-Asp-Asp) domain-containing protein
MLAVVTVCLTAASAILVKERSGGASPLAVVDIKRPLSAPERFDRPAVEPVSHAMRVAAPRAVEPAPFTSDIPHPTSDIDPRIASLDKDTLRLAQDPSVRWFNGRPVRPARQIQMNVSGYCPDERSCGDSADGKTATLHSVFTNGMKLVAADTKVLPFGSLVTVPGYDNARVVPVLDRGGAIKGNKLDLLFPTYEEARQWGRQKVMVTVWEYADGKPAVDPRKLR